jgi:hypothetical protein
VSPFERIHAPPPAPAAPAAVQAVVELQDDDLEQVVGGLARVYLPGMSIAKG